MSEYFKQWAQNLTHPSEVAKVILQAVTADNPDFRYTVGKDAAMTLESNLMTRNFAQHHAYDPYHPYQIILW
jgi:hypothetical protein